MQNWEKFEKNPKNHYKNIMSLSKGDEKEVYLSCWKEGTVIEDIGKDEVDPLDFFGTISQMNNLTRLIKQAILIKRMTFSA